VLQRFKSPEHAQHFLAPFGPISDHFRPAATLLLAPDYRRLLQTRVLEWRAVTGLAAAQRPSCWRQHASAQNLLSPAPFM
jgi:hypothetical protein